MFTTALFVVAKTWRQLKCPLIDDFWIKKMWYIYTIKYYSAMRKDEKLTFVTTSIDLENIKQYHGKQNKSVRES